MDIILLLRLLEARIVSFLCVWGVLEMWLDGWPDPVGRDFVAGILPDLRVANEFAKTFFGGWKVLRGKEILVVTEDLGN